jgi:hypothetical protein
VDKPQVYDLRDDQSRFAIEALLVAVRTWTFRDEWGVPAVYFSQVEKLAEAIMAGDAPLALRRHARHLGDECAKANCAVTCAHYLGRSDA